MDNASNITNKTWDRSEQYRIFLEVMTWTAALEIIFTVVGTFLNLWLLASILTSRDLRVRIRNQLICNLSILNLVQTFLKSPVMTSKAIIFLYRIRVSRDVFCQTFSITTVVEFIQSFIGDWLMVFVIIIFIAHILDFDTEAKLTPRTLKICKVVMHISPWIVGITLTFISVALLTRWHPCLLIPYTKLYAFEIAYTIIPTMLAIVLLVVAFVLRQRRFSRGTSTASGNMGVQLISRGPEIDNMFAYMVAVVVWVLCEICNLVFAFEIKSWLYRGIQFELAAYLTSDSRVVLMVFPWLLFPEIRQRILIWRPWKRQATGIDLTIAYGKEP